ncbi:MAG: hypothetical protein P8Y60_11325, partial [Calditrichota bacterium]
MRVLRIMISLFYISVFLCSCGVLESNLTPDMCHDDNLNDFVIYAFSPDGDSFAVIDLLTGEIYRQMNDFKGIQSVISNEQGTSIFMSTYNQGSNTGGIYKVNTATWEYEIIYEKAAHLIENREGG